MRNTKVPVEVRGLPVWAVALAAAVTGALALLGPLRPTTLTVIALTAAPLAVTALGLLVVFRTQRIVNFAQADMGLVGAAFYAFLLTYNPLVRVPRALCGACAGSIPGPVLRLFSAAYLAAGVAAAVGLSWVVYRLIVRRFARAPRTILTVATLFIAQLVRFVGVFLLGIRQVMLRGAGGGPPPPPVLPEVPRLPVDLRFAIGAVRYTGTDLAVLLLAVGGAVALTAYFRRSAAGLAMRGSAENPDRAVTLGIDAQAVTGRSWLMAGALSGALAVLVIAGSQIADELPPTQVDSLVVPLAAVVVAGTGFIATAAWAFLLSLAGAFVPFAAGTVLIAVGVALLLRRPATRAEIEQATAWRSADEVRPIPRELRDRPEVRRWTLAGGVVAAVAVVALPQLLSPRQNNLLAATAVYGVLTSSLLVLSGWVGQISLGQIGFAAIGAYLTAVLPLPFPLDLLVAAVLCGLMAGVLGVPALRFRGVQLAVITLVFAAAVQRALLSSSSFLGVKSIEVVDRPTLFGLPLDDDRTFFYLALAVLVTVALSLRRLRRSRVGRALVAGRDNERAAQSYGVDLFRARVGAFALSGGLAGLAGGLLFALQFGLKAEFYDIDQNVLVFMMAVIGGLGSVAGPIIGATFFGALQIFALPDIVVYATTGGTGIIMLLVLPGGVGQAVFAGRDAVLRRFAIRNRIAVPSLLRDARREADRATLGPKKGRSAATGALLRRYRLSGQWAVSTRLGGSAYDFGRMTVAKTMNRGRGRATADLELDDGTAACRQLIPTERQAAEGKGELPLLDGASSAPGRGPEEERTMAVRRSQRWRVALADRNPFVLTGSVRPLAVMASVGFFRSLGGGLLLLAITQIRAEFGVGTGAVVAITGALGALVGPLVLVGSRVADRFPRAPLVRIGTLLGAALFTASSMTTTFPAYTLTQTASGIALALVGPATSTIVLDSHPPEERIRVSSILGASGALGLVAGAAIGGIVIDVLGWRQTTFFVGVAGMAVALLTFLVPEPVRGYWERVQQGVRPQDARRSTRKVGLLASLRVISRIPTLRRFWVASSVLFLGRLLGEGFTTLVFLDVYQLPLGQVGLVRALGFAGVLIGVAGGAPIADRLMQTVPDRLMAIVAASALVAGILIFWLSTIPPLWGALLALVVLNFVFAVPGIIQVGAVSQVIPVHVLATGIYSVTVINLLGAVVLPFLGIVQPGLVPGEASGAALALPVMIVGSVLVLRVGSTIERDVRAARAAAIALAEIDAARQGSEGEPGGDGEPPASVPAIVVRDLDVAYRGVQVLFNVNVTVAEGEAVALLGTNGAGKSTVLRALAGLQPPSNGAIFIDGTDVSARPAHEHAEHGVITVPGTGSVFPTLTVEENLRVAGWRWRRDGARLQAGIEDALARFPALTARRHEMAGNMSGGEQRMLSLAQAMMLEPRVLLVDELSIGLAPAIVNELVRMLDRIRAAGTTLLVVEQTLGTAVRLADRAVFMEKGEVRFSGPIAALAADTDLVRSVFVGGATTGRRMRGQDSAAAQPAAAALLEVSDVAVSFGGVQALSGADLRVAPGETLGIVGPNGAGKTTLFDVVSGFVSPDRGEVLLDGVDVKELGPTARARVGITRSFQAALLFPSLTVREALAVARERHLAPKTLLPYVVGTPAARTSERRLRRRVEGLIDLLGLEAYADKFVGELSTGTRRVVDLGCAMAAEPRVLLLDEPSSGLAQAESEQLGPLVRRMAREMGCAVIVIDHDTNLIRAVSDRITGMALGRTIVTGEPDEVLSDPRLVAAYLGEPSPSRETQPAPAGVA